MFVEGELKTEDFHPDRNWDSDDDFKYEIYQEPS